MSRKAAFLVLSLSLCAATAWSEYGAGSSSHDLLHRADSLATQAKNGKSAEYAPNELKEALLQVSAAQAASANGNTRLAEQKAELSILLLQYAETRATERELIEQVAVRRVELKKLEAALEKNLQGGGN